MDKKLREELAQGGEAVGALSEQDSTGSIFVQGFYLGDMLVCRIHGDKILKDLAQRGPQ